MRINFLVFCVFLCHFRVSSSDSDNSEKCFCQLSGQIDDCFCDIEILEKFNNVEVYPLLQQLIHKDFFRYYKVNLFKPCLYFDGNAGLCENESCGVKTCTPEELPIGLRDDNEVQMEAAAAAAGDCDKAGGHLGSLNETISNKTLSMLGKMDEHDDTVHRFCDLEDDTSPSYQYVDLLANPERYTGYKGPMAERVWKAIYEENCFAPELSITNYYNPMFNQSPRGKKSTEQLNSIQYSSELLKAMCLEKRVFYRVISGLHTSINVHVCEQYLFEDVIVSSNPFIKEKYTQRWGPNLSEFQRRFHPEQTNGEGTERLKNLYFIYLIELRALSKVAQYFQRNNKFQLYTGKEIEDRETKKLLLELLQLTKKFPMHFDEGVMFRDRKANKLKSEFAERFLNVTRIIDCVTCEKCRLWGKLQTQGLGTALKILFSQKEITSNKATKYSFKLVRQEIVSLINAFARLSSSIKSLETFRDLLTKTNTSGTTSNEVGGGGTMTSQKSPFSDHTEL